MTARHFDADLVLRALDQLGLELTEHGHTWPTSTRRLYEGAVAEVRAQRGREPERGSPETAR